MSNENDTDYAGKVADLTAEAFRNLGNGLVREPGDGRENFILEAQLQMAAAQALATLGHAREARIQALIQIAALESVGGEVPDKTIAQDAYAVAAVMLGLVENVGDTLDLEELRAALAGEDPADKDLGDLS